MIATINIEVEVGSKKFKKIRLKDEDVSKLQSFKKRYLKSADLKSIADHEDINKFVNVEVVVLKQLQPQKMKHPDKGILQGSSIYILHQKLRSKLILWEPHSKLKDDKGDELVVVNAKIKPGSNGVIQHYTDEESIVKINPNNDDLREITGGIQVYISKAWKRPRGKIAEFVVAPSNRAESRICKDKISSEDLKIVKPEFIETPEQNRVIPGNNSFHLECVLDDEHGEEVLYEAITRLNQKMISKYKKNFNELLGMIPEDLKVAEALKKLF